MSIAQASLAVTAGTTYTQYVGSAQTVGAVVVLNESPYGLNVSNGSSSQWIAAQTADLVPCDSPAFSGVLSLSTDSYLDNASSAPSFLVYFTTYAPGEAIRGTYPAPLVRLTNGGNVGTPSNTLEQDMWTPFILSGVTPSHTGNTYQTTAGVAFLRQSDNSLLRIAVNATSNTLTGISTTYYHDLNPDGSFSLGTTHSTQPNYLTIATIVTNGSGNITTVTDTRVMSSLLWNAMQNVAGGQGVNVYNLHVYKDIQADDLISVQGTLRVTSGSNGDGYTLAMGGSGGDNLNIQPTSASSNDASIITFYVNPNGTPPLTAIPVLCLGYASSLGAVQIDTGGVIHANAPLSLVSGYQETGTTGAYFQAAAGSSFSGGPTNFKTVMTNTPASITINSSATQNVGSTGIEKITVYGFTFFAVSSAAGIAKWEGTYTTAGNCLLAVDSAAQTFDHHCDACGHVSMATPFAALRLRDDEYARTLAYACPVCGAEEHFNVELSATDEADTTPQGTGEYQTTRGAQAALIRALQTALGLPTLP